MSDTVFIYDIPVIESFSSNSKYPMPFVILSHGFLSDKKSFSGKNNLMERLSDRGFFVVSFDNRAHGQRRDKSFVELVKKGILKFDIYEVRKLIKESADDVAKIIDHYEDNPLVDRKNIGIAGISMGGFVAYRAALIDERIKALAPIIASPCWEDVPKINPPLSLDMNPEIFVRLKEFAKEYSPNYFIDGFKDKRILMQNGDEDEHVHITPVRDFYNELSKINPFAKLIVYPSVRHGVTEEMLDKALSFFLEVMMNEKEIEVGKY